MAASLILALLGAVAAPDISSFVQSKLKDATFTARVGRSDQRELKKINDDFAQSYRFKSTKVYAKEPFKLRLEATVEDQSIYFILNGTTRWYRLPSANINHKEDLSGQPGKRQTWLDFGVLTPGLFRNLFVGTFVRTDKDSGRIVFDITYANSSEDSSRHRVFIDPAKKYVTRREWYAQDGTLRAIFLYEAPVHMNGAFFPTKLTVKNAEGKTAGTSSYIDIKLNAGLADSLFSVK